MPQEHCVLKCFSCETFQAHIVKKAKKWECKICRVKQSLKRNYGKGSGLDCRKQVMKLNELRLTNRYNNSEFLKDTTDDSNENFTKEHLNVEKPVISKWAVYLETDAPVNDSKTDFLEILDKDERAKNEPGYCYSKNKNICMRSVKSETKDDSVSSNQGNLYSFYKSEKKIEIAYPVQLKNESKPCKNKKKDIIEEKDKSDVIKAINKNSNIFESDLSDLDDILNL